MSREAYLSALHAIPPGETRTFRELAALAGRPGAARAAGRAVFSAPARGALPWHRVVAADGALSRDPARAALQLTRLRREGARPRARETVPRWLARVGAPLVGRLPERALCPADDPRAARWPAARVEPLFDPARARARGFVDPDAPPAPEPPRRRRRPGRRPPCIGLRIDRVGSFEALFEEGVLHVPRFFAPSECELLVRACEAAPAERTVDMARHDFGAGTYRYLRALPQPAGELRTWLYSRVLDQADLQLPEPLPEKVRDYERLCRAAGQRRASSIYLRYTAGGVNHPHRDRYGDVQHPYQALVVLSKRGTDFDGGEFVLYDDLPSGPVEHRVVPASEGDLVVFAARERWIDADPRPRRLPVRHGMRLVTRGERLALGIVFHLAR